MVSKAWVEVSRSSTWVFFQGLKEPSKNRAKDSNGCFTEMQETICTKEDAKMKSRMRFYISLLSLAKISLVTIRKGVRNWYG